MNTQRKNVRIALTALVLAAAVYLVGGRAGWFGDSANRTTEKLDVIKFGMLPYGDHTQAIIGIKKGWFEDVGIRIDYEVIKIENVVPFLYKGELDMCSSPAGLLYPAYDTAPGLGIFVFADIFQGYAIMSQPGLQCRSFDEFLADGMDREDAFRATMQQLKGKVFAYPSETAIKPFIDIVTQKGGLKVGDFEPLVQDDSLTINSMRQKTADFQVGGAPSRITLTKEGYKPIITSLNVASTAKPSHLSRELGSVFPDGWAIRKQMLDEHRDLVLRMASVCFRINDYIINQTDEALAVHMPFLTTATGEQFTAKDGRIIYESLNPFYTFKQQYSWYHNSEDPFYYKHINGAGLQSFIDQGIYRNSVPKLEDFIYADDIYFELESLKKEAEGNFAKLEDGGSLRMKASKLLESARKHHSIYNYYDSARLSAEALAQPE